MAESVERAGVCPPCPTEVPPDLRRPSARYRRLAAASALVLVVALVAYVALMLWFGWTGVQLVWSGTVLPDRTANLFVGGGALLVAAVLASSFVRLRTRASFDGCVTVTEEEQPTLFAFLRQVAREVGAPMPDRVVLVATVDAAVVSVPGRWWRLEGQSRTLVLGLGLVAGLDLRELKALVAHELGHLGHLSTPLGRWSQRGFAIAATLIQPRQWPLLGEIPIIGHWIMIIPIVLLLVTAATIWAITAVTTTLFGWVLRVQRAFERECEHEADLAAVAVAGSDAATTLLFRTAALHERNAMAIAFAHREAARGRAVVDLFAVQARLAELVPGIKGDPADGVPPAPTGDPAQHRIFTPGLAALPSTWHSHPNDDERERTMKARYVAAPTEPRAAWTAFDDVATLRAQVTTRAMVRPSWEPPLAATPVEESLATLERELGRPSLAPRFHGLYLDRETTRVPPRTVPLGVADPLAALASLESSALAEDVAHRRRVRRDLSAIDGLLLGVLVARGRTVRYRDRDYGRAELPSLRATLEAELVAVSQRLAEREAYARAVHRQLAAQLSPAWVSAVQSLWSLWHWAEHSHAGLAEVMDALAPVVERVAAGGEISERDRRALVTLGRVLAARFAQLHGTLHELQVPPGAAARLRNPQWYAAFMTPLPMPPPFGELSGWLHYALQIATRALDALDDGCRAARDELLALEDRVATLAVARAGGGEPVEAAPPAARVPARYALHDAAVPAITPPTWRARWREPLRETARVAAAAALIGGLAVATHFLRKVDIVAYNGTGGPVTITIDGERHVVAAGDHRRFRVGAGRISVSARTPDGETIESFREHIDERHRYVYDVAAAMPLSEVMVVYSDGPGEVPAPRPLPLRRWHEVRADWLFETPPQTREISSGERTRFTLIAAPRDEHPLTALEPDARDDAEAITEAQLRWRPSDARFASSWWGAGDVLVSGSRAILERRLARAPDDPLLRFIEGSFAGDRRDAVCADHRARAAVRLDDPSWQYLAARCLDPGARGAAMAAVHARWPDAPWPLLGAGEAAAARGEYEWADAQLTAACRALPNHCDAFVLDIARVRRATTRDAFGGLPIASGPYRVFLQIAPDTWPRQLARHELDAAIGTATQAAPLEVAVVRWLVAASDGEPLARLDAAEAEASAAASDPSVALLAYALRRRAGRAAPTDLDEAVNATAAEHAHDATHAAAALRAFLGMIPDDGAVIDADAADAALGPIAPVLRGRAYVAAAILLGPRCPPRWRTLATQLLFDHERPWFAAT